MNKYEVVLDMFKNKILFFFKRCDHNNNKILTLKDLSFLSNASFIIIIRSFKLIVKNDSNENNFDMNHFKDVFNRKRSTSTLKAFKEMKIQKSDLIDIVEINALTYYYLIRNKENKLFSLTINEICDTPIQFLEVSSQMKRDNRISINKSCLYGFIIEYKRCCEFYTSKFIQINNVDVLTLQKMLNKLFINYYNYINVFNRSQANILSSHRFYDYRLKFAKGADKNTLFKSRIYSILNYKFE